MGRLTDRPDMTIGVYRGRITTTQQNKPHPDKDLPNNSQRNIHSNNVPRHDTYPNNKHPQSVSHPKPRHSTRTSFPHYLYFPK